MRLQEKTLYFTETAKSALVMGSMKFTGVKDSSAINIPGCFEVSNKFATWSLCETKDGEGDEWVCKIKEALGLKCDLTDGVATVKKIKVTQPVMIVPLPSPDCATDWNYDLHGTDWVCNCNEGLEQSPIDLPFG